MALDDLELKAFVCFLLERYTYGQYVPDAKAMWMVHVH